MIFQFTYKLILFTVEFNLKLAKLSYFDANWNATRVYELYASTVYWESQKASVIWNSYIISASGKKEGKEPQAMFYSEPEDWELFHDTATKPGWLFKMESLNGFCRRIPELDGKPKPKKGEGNICFLPDGTPVAPLEVDFLTTPETEAGADGEIVVNVITQVPEAVEWSVNDGEFSTNQPTGLQAGNYVIKTRYRKLGVSGNTFDVNGITQTVQIQKI